MSTQETVWIITLIGVGLIAAVFIWVIARSTQPPPVAPQPTTVRKIQKVWFAVLVIAGVGIAYATLTPFPIVKQTGQTTDAQVVDAVAHQWWWQIEPAQVKVGIPVEFRVTSADVNHGFAIYTPDDRIVAQTQAMPGYTNRLRYTFTEPGKYQVLCLEYCGLAHHGMVGEIDVVAADAGETP